MVRIRDKEKNRKHQHEWYLRNKRKQLDKNNAIRKRNVAWTNSYKQIHPCSKCGESDICCLEFHHVDSSTKEENIARSVTGGWSIKRIEREVAKCIVLCANCHRKLHRGVSDALATSFR
jgi:hypothetical protein